MTQEAESKSLATIRDVIDSARPLIYLQSSEEDRACALLAQAASGRGGAKMDLFVWSVTDGLQHGGRSAKAQPEGPRGMLDYVIVHEKPAIFVLKDFHEYLSDAEIRRRLRDIYAACMNAGKFAVILAPVRRIPEELSREVAYLTLPPPDVVELGGLVREEADRLGAGLAEEQAYMLVRALQGLTFNEARHAIRRAVAVHGKLDPSVVPTLQEEKRLLVRKTGLIEYVPDTAPIEDVGGVEVLKKWLTERRELFYSRESLSAEIVPKGLLLMGVSGCGKSLSARSVANVFELPLYRIDMVRVFAEGLGRAERLFADACRAMEEVAPAIIWFDEIEMGISAHHQESSGVLDRIFAFFLTWMQEKPLGLFVAATANRIDLLPAEMIRKGRFDQVFFLDLPDKDERQQIFEIHLRKRGVDPAGLSVELVASRTDGWTGAEIEQCVVAAIISARLAKEPLTDKYLLPSLRQIVPLSKTMKEQVNHIRSWAFDRAVRASAKK